MSKYLETPQGETYKYSDNAILADANIFQLLGLVIENINETNKSRTKTAREIIDETLSFKLNIYEKLALHFSKEAMLAEKNRDLVLGIFDTLTFNKKHISKIKPKTFM